MLGAGKEIVANYVLDGRVKIVFWPISAISANSKNAAVANYCVGQQDVEAYWRYLDYLFAEQGSIYRADEAYFTETAVRFGADRETFTACYNDTAVQKIIEDLDNGRLERGVRGRPVFDIGEQRLIGNQPYATFVQLLDALLQP